MIKLRPIHTAPPVEGKLIGITYHDEGIPEIYTGLWIPYEECFTVNEMEYKGYYWLLNDNYPDTLEPNGPVDDAGSYPDGWFWFELEFEKPKEEVG